MILLQMDVASPEHIYKDHILGWAVCSGALFIGNFYPTKLVNKSFDKLYFKNSFRTKEIGYEYMFSII